MVQSGIYNENTPLLTCAEVGSFCAVAPVPKAFGRKMWEAELPNFLLTINELDKNVRKKKKLRSREVNCAATSRPHTP